MTRLKFLIPALIGLAVSLILWVTLRWWGVLVIFPWCGFSISAGMFLRQVLTGRRRLLGRKVALLMILPCLLFFVPLVNRENFQLEGVALIVMVGFFGKGFIHYALAKLFGPLIWRRGFCGYACWTAAVLEWLPIRGRANQLPRVYRRFRYVAFALSLLVPAFLIFALSYDVRADYLNRQEMAWMFVSNGLYYAVAVPLAFVLRDRRAFCKYVCPVAVVMKPASSVGLLKIRVNPAVACTGCGACNRVCPMGVNVMGAMTCGRPVTDTECVLCSDCSVVCPTGRIA
jgi:polyferredoxin